MFLPQSGESLQTSLPQLLSHLGVFVSMSSTPGTVLRLDNFSVYEALHSPPCQGEHLGSGRIRLGPRGKDAGRWI